ncbi:hypothetical protein GCM10023085_23720 [Actinomadura viridis]
MWVWVLYALGALVICGAAWLHMRGPMRRCIVCASNGLVKRSPLVGMRAAERLLGHKPPLAWSTADERGNISWLVHPDCQREAARGKGRKFKDAASRYAHLPASSFAGAECGRCHEPIALEAMQPPAADRRHDASTIYGRAWQCWGCRAWLCTKHLSRDIHHTNGAFRLPHLHCVGDFVPPGVEP